MSGSTFPTARRKNRFKKVRNNVEKYCFASNLKKQIISTRKILKNVTQQRNPGELTVPEQEETARHLHHNNKKQ